MAERNDGSTVPEAPGSRLLGAVRGLRARVARQFVDLRVRVLTERYPTAVDLLFALVLFAVTFFEPMVREHPELWGLQAGLVLPIAFRRRAPLTVFALTASVAFAQWLTAHIMPADVALLLGLYTVTVHRSRAWAWAALATGELGALLAAIRWAPVMAHPDSPHLNVFKVFMMFSASVVAASVVGSNVRGRRAQLAGLRLRAEELERQRDQQAALAVVRERSRIAREMHDVITHNLSVMVALSDGAAYANPASPERATAAMVQSAETGRRALTDMRRFLGVLRADEPDALRHPQPGIGQLAALADQVRAAGLATELKLTGDHAEVPQAAQLTAYRLVQESLTNTLKHTAPGSRATVRVHSTAEAVDVEVLDDGRALRPPPPEEPGRVRGRERAGHGLAGMHERVATYGGELAAGPRPNGGWRVRARLDLTE
jgi:signal transduction histidine kinase